MFANSGSIVLVHTILSLAVSLAVYINEVYASVINYVWKNTEFLQAT